MSIAGIYLIATRKLPTLLLCLLPLFSACNSNREGKWAKTKTNLSIWAERSDNSTYEWEGGSFDTLIHGKGVLSVFSGNSLKSKKEVNAYYGSINEKDIHELSNNDEYVGELRANALNGYGALVKSNGEIYVGTFKDGKPHGLLSLYKKGTLHYTGNWENGLFHGKGVLHKENGEILDGVWNQGKLEQSFITLETPSGNYTGNISNSQPEGYGVMRYKSGDSYEGTWRQGKRHGDGALIFTAGSIVIGGWKNGKLEGYGIHESTAAYYEGLWANNRRDGLGFMQYADSSFYSGQWVAGKKDGYGDLVYSSSDAYFGAWKSDKRNGFGKYFFANGSTYTGEWKDDYQHGYGVLQTSSFTYEGRWEKGNADGLGKVTYSNGDYYIGSFAENEKHGTGEYHFKNGNLYEGEFVKDTFNGYGILHFNNGSQYQGEFANGRIVGEGTLYHAEQGGATAITGVWEGSASLPKQASILFPNGDVYKGPIKDGEPTGDGTWSTEAERSAASNRNTSIPRDVVRANEFYKKHRATWNKAVVATSVVLVASTFTQAAPIAVPALATLNILDAGVAMGSAYIDGDYKALGWELAVNLGFIYAPKIGKKALDSLSPLAKTLSSQAARSIMRAAKPIEGRIIVVWEKNRFIKKSVLLSKQLLYKKQFTTSKEVSDYLAKGGKLLLEYPASSRILRSNIFAVMRNIPWWARSGANAAHHIVSGSKSNLSAQANRRLLAKYGVDINDPLNGIFLPTSPESILRGTIHQNHFKNYDDYVASKFKSITSKDDLFHVLDELKLELYKGQATLSEVHKANTPLGFLRLKLARG